MKIILEWAEVFVQVFVVVALETGDSKADFVFNSRLACTSKEFFHPFFYHFGLNFITTHNPIYYGFIFFIIEFKWNICVSAAKTKKKICFRA